MKRTSFLSLLIVFFTISFMSLVGCNNQTPTKEQPKEQTSVSEKQVPNSTDWIKYKIEKDKSICSYRIVQRMGDIVEVLDKKEFTEEGKIHFLAEFERQIPLGKQVPPEWNNLSIVMNLSEIDCNEKMVDYISTTILSSDGNVLDIIEGKLIPNKQKIVISSGSPMDELRKNVCR